MSTEGKTSSGQYEGTQIQIGPNLCNVCDTGDPAIRYCQQCHEYLCAECTKFHNRQSKTKEHDLLDIVLSHNHQNVNRCLQHDDCIVKFCISCNDFICMLCLEDNHKGHDVRDITGDCSSEVEKRAAACLQINVEGTSTIYNKLRGEVKLMSGTIGFGFDIAGGSDNQHIPGDNGIFVAKIKEGGSMHKDGIVKEGDKIIAIDGVNIENVTHSEAVALIMAATKGVKLSVEKQWQSAAGSASAPDADEDGQSENTREFLIKKGKYGFGFNVISNDAVNKGIYISAINKPGPECFGGELRIGDRLLAVEGTNLQNATHIEAVRVLKRTSNLVRVRVKFMPEELSRIFAQRNSTTSAK